MKPWLRELRHDLDTANRSPYFAPVEAPFGFVYGRKGRGFPEVGEPNLLYFPPPYHPIEVVAALRGYGGLRHGDPTLPQKRLREIALGRAGSGPLETFSHIGKWLFWTPAQSVLAAHLLTPYNVPYKWGRRPSDVARLREDLGIRWSVSGPAFGNFWKIVDPEWDELV